MSVYNGEVALFIDKSKIHWEYMIEGDVVAVIVWYLDLLLPMQSVPITTDVVSSNHEMYNIMW